MGIGFPGFQDLNRRTVRAPVNPLDTSTIVSIFPLPIVEIKPTLQPSRFVVEAGSFEKPVIQIVQPASWWRELDENQPLLEIPVSSIQIAESIVNDYCNGLLACDMDTQRPGLFSLPGSFTIEKIRRDYQHLLNRANEQQRNWYHALVRIADTLWARTNGNALAIDNTMRLAAQELQLNEKPWIKDFTTMEMKNCPACGALRMNDFPVCANCKIVIDRTKFDALGMKFA